MSTRSCVGHPRDPFHRIDIVHSSRHVRVELVGEARAESRNPYLLFEPPQPLREAAEITDRLAFFNERVDLVVDGKLLERPVTPWSPRARSA